MFGLMRARKCGMTDAEKRFRRLNYCGTCKTIGKLYGGKSRLLLDHDAVFLAEILSALSGENVNDWEKSFQSFNCLTLPVGAAPRALEFAATANVVLTEFKLADHAHDSRRKRFKLVSRAFSKEFRRAEKLLREWNFPLETVRADLATQAAREAAGESLEDLAFPTAETTAVFFAEGARRVGKSEHENEMRALGFAFGKLVYLLDAFEDYEKDFRENQFNAFRTVFDLKENKIPGAQKRRIAAVLRELEREIVGKIYELPLAANQKSLFAARLAENLQRKLKTNLPVIGTKKLCAAKPKKSFAVRWQNAREKASNLARDFSWQTPLVFLFVFVFALVAPAQTREAKSARECFDLGFNIMALGAFFGAVAAFPKTILIENPEELLTKEGRRKKLKKAASGESGDGGWCESCDCCCDCGGCGCGSCDKCGCDGCCDCSCSD